MKVFAGVWGWLFSKSTPTKEKAILGRGPKMAAGAIEWSSVQIKNHLYTHAIKVFAGAWGWLFSKSTPTKRCFFQKSFLTERVYY